MPNIFNIVVANIEEEEVDIEVEPVHIELAAADNIGAQADIEVDIEAPVDIAGVALGAVRNQSLHQR